MTDLDVAATYDAFINGRLGIDEWTHEAHLAACLVALETRTPAESIDFLRDAITAHNCGIAIRNTETSGYHETLTVYYVTAVHHAVADAGASTLDGLLAEPTCGRKAPLNHWSETVLWSPEARLGWIPPDLAALPWPRA